MNNLSKINKIYEFVCDIYEKDLQFHVQRFSNNSRPKFTDQQTMTMYIYCTACEKRLTIRDMYDFTRIYLSDVFVNLPSYVAICNRIARLAPAFKALFEHVTKLNIEQEQELELFSLMDSFPIITCSSKRSAKVAREIVNKGYCSTKSMHYYGVKIHALARHKSGTIPLPESIVVTPASEHDGNVFKANWCNLNNRIYFADKIYQDSLYQSIIKTEYNSELLSPVKYPAYTPLEIKLRNKAADDLYSRAVSSIRQPIESLFNWLIETTNIQRASKIRSTNGLLSFIFGKLAAVFLIRKFFKP